MSPTPIFTFAPVIRGNFISIFRCPECCFSPGIRSIKDIYSCCDANVDRPIAKAPKVINAAFLNSITCSLWKNATQLSLAISKICGFPLLGSHQGWLYLSSENNNCKELGNLSLCQFYIRFLNQYLNNYKKCFFGC